MTNVCAYCGHSLQVPEGSFCPYCGERISEPTQAEPSELALLLEKEKNPKKKYKLIQAALSRNPDDFEANEALLYLGRLHEPLRGKDIDFSVIKCHLLCIYDEPERLRPDTIEQKWAELFEGEALRRVMALSGDEKGFFVGYLRRLAREYVELFIRGSNRYASFAFGIPRPPDSMARSCGVPVARMVERVAADERLPEETRQILVDALQKGYAAVFPGYSV